MIMLKTHLGADVPYKLPKGKPTFNKTNQQVDWSAWTWNPVTGCLHDCKYCYAREVAEMSRNLGARPIRSVSRRYFMTGGWKRRRIARCRKV